MKLSFCERAFYVRVMLSLRRFRTYFAARAARDRADSVNARAIVLIERLEQRIAPATLIDAKNISFHDIDGDEVMLTASKAIFKAGTINSVLKFDNGKVNGNNDALQQLQMINLSALPAGSVKGVSLSISAIAAGGGDGFVDVGFINAQHRDLGTVTISGDLGGLTAGDKNDDTLGLQTLIADTIGASGLATQRPNGSLETKVRGGLGSLLVTHDIVSATVGAAGKKGVGTIDLVNIGGNLIGGGGEFSGSIRATGPIGPVTIGGDLIGGSGADSGVIGTSKTLSTVIIDGSLRGGSGPRSGSVRATGDIESVLVNGSVMGGGGVESGAIGSAGQIGAVAIGGSLTGGSNRRSGTVLSTGGIGDAGVGGDVLSGAAPETGVIGSDGALGAVSIGGRLEGAILSSVSIGSVLVAGDIANATIRSVGDIGLLSANTDGTAAVGIRGTVINAGGDITAITAFGDLEGDVIVAGLHAGSALNASAAGKSPQAIGFASFPSSGTTAGSIGPIALSPGAMGATSAIKSTSIIAGITGPGPDGVYGTLDDRNGAGSTIGGILAGGGIVDSFIESGAIGLTAIANGQIARTTYLATDASGTGIDTIVAANVDDGTAAPNAGIANSRFHSASGIVAVSGATLDTSFGSNGIVNSEFRAAGGSIGSIVGVTFDPSPIDPANAVGAILKSAFNARDGIGAIDASGHIESSIFIAGIDLGGNFASGLAAAGSFNDAAAADFGFPGVANGTGGSIASISTGGTLSGQIDRSTFLAGVNGVGGDGKFGTVDDATGANATIGAINAPGGISFSTFQSNAIAETQVVAGRINGAVFRTTNPTGAGIGDLTVSLNSAFAEQLIAGSTFESAAAIGNINALLTTSSNGLSSGISNSSVLAGSAIGNVFVLLNVNGAPDSDGIVNLTMRAGMRGGAGGIGNIDVSVSGNVFGNVGTAGIRSSTFDAGNGNIASITASSDGSPGLRTTTFRARGDIGAVLSSGADATFAMDRTVLSASGNIGAIGADGDVLGGRILAGYDIGTDMTFGNEDLLPSSAALIAGTSIGRIDITGIVTGDIIASVNPGNGYVFGDANDANVGAGGSLGLISVQENTRSPLPDGIASHAIEAAVIADGDLTPTRPGIQITVNGLLTTLPFVLDNGAGPDNVRVRIL
jgi:hypothetical protein